MTFDTLKQKSVRFSFTAFEIDLDINDPALDSVFAMQADSYGTPKTTTDPRAYTGTNFKTYRYTNQNVAGLDHFPYLVDARSNNPTVEPGKSIGFRASAKVTLRDFISNDNVFEVPPPYNDTRRVSGSHWLKLEARNHFKNRRCRIVRGFNPNAYDTNNTQVEHYIIDSWNIRENGSIEFSLVDELILTEATKAKAPNVSQGELSADLALAATVLNFTTPVTDEYGAIGATGFIAIEKEIMGYTVATATTMNLTRGQFGTSLADHSNGETIQLCLAYQNVNIIDIFSDLITNYTRIDNSYIPTAEWEALKNGDLANYNLTRAFSKATDVKNILNSLVVIAGLSVYIDVIQRSIKIVTSPNFANPVVDFDETEHIERNSLRVPLSEKDQVTRQAVLWDKNSATESDDDNNFRKSFQVVDGVVEGQADISNISEANIIKANWLVNSLEDNSIATSIAQLRVNRFATTPRIATFTVDQRYIDNVTGGRMWLGSIFSLTTKQIVDAGLNPVKTTFQCTRIKPSREASKWDVTGLSYIAAAPPTADLFISSNQVDYLLSDHLTTDEAREYTVVINSNVEISASSTTETAFSQGVFFAGATLKIINLGRVIGAGGNGGLGGAAGPSLGSCAVSTPGDGFDAGDAMTLTTDATIDNQFGLIGGGGGGGAGIPGTCEQVSPPPDPEYLATGGQGGGGGQGSTAGTGGAGGNGSSLNGPDGIDGSAGAPGGNGGALGEDGNTISGASGGDAGAAIQTNGNSVTITAGNNSEQIKGDII